MDLLTAIITSFITIFAIMDPFASLSPFLAFTKDCKDNELRGVANKSVLIAGVVAIIFVIAGPPLLVALSITLNDFKIAGGIVLVLLGLENTLNLNLGHAAEEKTKSLDSAAVLIGTPLLTGPGLMTSLIVLDKEVTIVPVLIALCAALFICWLIFIYSSNVRKILGDRFIQVFSKVMGLFLIAIGISFIRSGFAAGG